MNAVFNDLQDYSSSLDGASVHNRQELFAVLDGARHREPFACELEGENGYKLTIGVGEEYGFVQHSRTDGDSPYLVAVAEGPSCREEYIDFLCGNTPSPISCRNVLTFEKVKEIAAHFIETGERDPAFSWEEI
jgi:hypothetical protein